MYQQFFGFTQLPFKITPDERVFFAGAHRQEMLDALLYAIDLGEGLVTVTGEVGIGKTTLARVLSKRFAQQFVIVSVFTPNVEPLEMLLLIAQEAGLQPSSQASKSELVRLLYTHGAQLHQQGKRFLILIDEAQTMPFDTIEELRLLSNMQVDNVKLVQVLLFGQPELDRMLDQPKLRQVKDRIVFQIHIQPFSRDELADYLAFRIAFAGFRGQHFFTADVVDAIYDKTLGYPRAVNRLADQALMAAFAEQTHQVRADHVSASQQQPMSRWQDDEQTLPVPTQDRIWTMSIKRWVVLLVMVAALIVVGGAWVFISSEQRDSGDYRKSVAAENQNQTTVLTQPTSVTHDRKQTASVNATVASSPITHSPTATPTDSDSATDVIKQESPSPLPTQPVSVTQSPAPAVDALAESVNASQAVTSVTFPEVRITATDVDHLHLRSGEDNDQWRTVHQQLLTLFTNYAQNNQYSIQLMSSPWRLRQPFVQESMSLISALPKLPAFYYDYSASVTRPRIAVIYGVFDSKEAAQQALVAIEHLGKGYRPEMVSFQKVVALMQHSHVLEEAQ